MLGSWGRRTGLPVIHLDEHFWHPGWVATPSEEWRRDQADLLTGDEWIVDGNYGDTFDVRMARADTVVVLAPPRRVCLTRVLRRSLANWRRAIQAEGCPERFDKEFLRWVWRWQRDSRPRLDAALAEHGAHLPCRRAHVSRAQCARSSTASRLDDRDRPDDPARMLAPPDAALHPWNVDFDWALPDAEPTTLSNEQKEAFDRDGFVVLDDVVEPELLDDGHR